MTFEFEILKEIEKLKRQVAYLRRLEKGDTDLSGYALDADVVHDTGDETVAGVKTFSSIPVLPASDPTSDNQAVRKAFVDELSLGKIVAVKSAVFTGTQAASVGANSNTTITDLSIAHALSSSDNKLILFGQVGIVAHAGGYGTVGVAFAAGGTLINIGDSASNRGRVSAWGKAYGGGVFVSQSRHISLLYSPGGTSSITYTLKIINPDTVTRTLYVNRTERDSDNQYDSRGASSLILMEVAG